MNFGEWNRKYLTDPAYVRTPCENGTLLNP